MNPNEIAHQVAVDLASEYGPGLVEKTDEAFNQRAQATRGVIEHLHTVVAVGHIAHFLWIVTPIMVAKWTSLRDRRMAEQAGEEVNEQKKMLDATLAKRIINSIAERITKSE